MTTVSDIFRSMSYGPAPESTARAEEWLDGHDRRFGHFIDGRWVEPGDGEWFDSINPAKNEVIAAVVQGSEADVDRAVAAARAAQEGWAALGGHGRARHLYAIARGIQRNSRLFAVLESLDNGKPIRESRDIDIPLVARHFYHHAGWAQIMDDELAGYDPIGVVGQIIPWNFPLLMLSWKIAPALSMGNTVVLKPAEFTSLSALLFAELCKSVGLPPGVVNIVTGDGRTGQALVAHDDVDKIAFTGSTEVGRAIRVATAGSGKKLSLELGGKSPFLVFEDADLDSVVEGVVDAIWFNQGQVCCAGSRILVQEGIAERLVTKLRERMENLRVGDPLDKAVDLGAIVAPVQLDRITELVEQGTKEGATMWQPSWSCPTEGFFYPPTLFTDVSPASTIAQVEIFGPVVVLMTFRTPVEAVALANDTRYGLAASIWTENINLALDVAPKVKAGSVWINCTNVFDAASGFGGYRESGFGREGGKEGLWEYVREADRRTGGQAVSDGQVKSTARETAAAPVLDRTAKMYIGGKQARPDGGYSIDIVGANGESLGQVGLGNRKDIRNAVEAAHKGAAWAKATAHNRAQVLYYVAENLSARADEFVERLRALTGVGAEDARAEFDLSIERLYLYAAWADKWDGDVHRTPMRNITLAMREPVGVMGVVCPDEAPLLGFISTVMPPLALGNRVVAVPSEPWPLMATDLYQVLETSDMPGGAINIVTGTKEELAPVLAAHDDVDGIWYWGAVQGSGEVERLAAGNMKRSWVDYGKGRDWFGAHAAGREFLRHATEIKNIWVPYGD